MRTVQLAAALGLVLLAQALLVQLRGFVDMRVRQVLVGTLAPVVRQVLQEQQALLAVCTLLEPLVQHKALAVALLEQCTLELAQKMVSVRQLARHR